MKKLRNRLNAVIYGVARTKVHIPNVNPSSIESISKLIRYASQVMWHNIGFEFDVSGCSHLSIKVMQIKLKFRSSQSLADRIAVFKVPNVRLDIQIE